jgi:Domain of unknown function (DUF5668)
MKCAVHPEVDATGFCRNCGKAMCAACTREVKGALYCEDCLALALSGATAAQAPVATGPTPWVAGVLGLVPGLGAVYNGEYTKAIIQLAIWGGLFAAGMSSIGTLSVLSWIAFGLFPAYLAVESYRVALAKRRGTYETQAELADRQPGSKPIGAMILIALGVLALLGNFNLLRGDWIDKGWPIILIVIGAYMLNRRVKVI